MDTTMTIEKITFQVDRSEKRLITQAAKDRSMNVSEFIRVAAKEKMDAQSLLLPIIEDMRAELSTRLTELERLVLTSELKSESAQDKFNHALTDMLRKGFVIELDQHLKFMDEHLRQNYTKTVQSNNAVATLISALNEKLGVFTKLEENNYKRLKALDELINKQAESKWFK
jgi:uncharacterized protein (DUF1778 family)